MKRIFDLFAATLALAVLSPLCLPIVFLIRSDGGPAFFRQTRVGKNGKLFQIHKFRSMVANADQIGRQITADHDPRITKIGGLLRKSKLDELPQLINVLRGEMSLVGPRPEVPYYTQQWPPEDREIILSVKPGITDYATVLYHDEQSVLAESNDPERAYIESVLPQKVALYRKYVTEQSMWLDIRLILSTLLGIAGVKSCFLLPEMRSNLEASPAKSARSSSK
jgi:lipopolysaccharide/colanic/teichoic acid biosynthesis glycosyltransferase